MKFSHLTAFVDKILLALSLLLLFLLIWGTLVNQDLKSFYDYLYNPLLVIFLGEYLIKLFLSKNKFTYIKDDPFGIFIAIFPFLRSFRLLSFSRFGLIVISEQLSDRLPWFKKYRVLEILLFTILLVIICSDLLLFFEKDHSATIKNFGDALWFSIATIGTVGYGDVYPTSLAGRIVAIVLIMFGISIFSLITAEVAAFFVDKDIKKDLEVEEKEIKILDKEDTDLKKLAENILKKEEQIEKDLAELKK